MAQDTTFFQRHFFPTPVRNVFLAEKLVYVKTGDGLYRLENGNWEKEKMSFPKPYVFYEGGFFESDFIPTAQLTDLSGLARLIPQYNMSVGTAARLDRSLFISVGGALYEYRINDDYHRTFPGLSIRHIYKEPGLEVVVSYAGIFVNKDTRIDSPYYANGSFTRVGQRYFLGSDRLFEFFKPHQFREISSGHNLFAGYSRKVLSFNGRLHALNTKSLNYFDDSMALHPIHQGFEYFDMEQVGNSLVFSTQTGECFRYDGNKVTQLCKLPMRIRDVYAYQDLIYLSSDAGVYTIRNMDPQTLQVFAELPHAVMVTIDAMRNTWVATENGLYLKPDRRDDFIPYVPDVEFNRSALTFYEDRIYAGSIEGLFEIDTYYVTKSFLPRYYNRREARDIQQRNERIVGILAVALTAFFAGYAYHRYQKKQRLLIPAEKEKEEGLSLEQVGEAIRSQQIMTVEGLAEYFRTNTVQLNRQFKTFDTTPGKFLKKVKLDMAREMLGSQVPMEEIVRATGYSAAFIKKELADQKRTRPA